MLTTVFVVLMVVLLLALLGVLPIFSSSNNGSSSGALTYDQARPLADGAAQATSGGSWALVVSSGILSTTAATENLSSISSADCNLTVLPGVSNVVTVPAGPSNQTGGTATGWVFLYRNAAGEMLIVAVLGGKATALGTIAAGQSCSTIFALLSVIPSNVIDSSVAASAVGSYAATFLASYPSVTSHYGLVGGISFLGHGVGAEWAVNYTTCPVNAAPGSTGASFNATVNATTGTIVYEQTRGLIGCSSSGTIISIHARSPAPLEQQINGSAVARRN